MWNSSNWSDKSSVFCRGTFDENDSSKLGNILCCYIMVKAFPLPVVSHSGWANNSAVNLPRKPEVLWMINKVYIYIYIYSPLSSSNSVDKPTLFSFPELEPISFIQNQIGDLGLFHCFLPITWFSNSRWVLRSSKMPLHRAAEGRFIHDTDLAELLVTAASISLLIFQLKYLLPYVFYFKSPFFSISSDHAEIF